MKKIVYLLSALTLITTAASAQKKDVDASYRRSSVCLILMDDTSMPKRDVIKESFLTVPMPEKYNDHNIAVRIYDPAKLTITDQDKKAYEADVYGDDNQKPKISNDTKKAIGAGLGMASKLAGGKVGSIAGKAGNVADNSAKSDDLAIKAHKYLLQQKVAKQLFDKWFIENGKFSMELIKERGLYDASAMDIQSAKSAVRGMAMLEDAGEELINNTFVVVSRFRYLSKDELVADIDAAAKLAASAVGGQVAAASAAASTAAIKASLGAGYYVKITSYLFKLNWNEDVAGSFYSELWDNKAAYDKSDIFSLQYVGEEMAWANVKAGIFTNKPEAELIRMATVNANDAVLAKLEKKYDVFKTKTPLLSVKPITAAIGMKEGIEPGDKYEVLEKVVDKSTGKTTYKRVTTLKVGKDVWDNRYMAGEERALSGDVQSITATTFEGDSKNLYPGLLLRQIK